MQDDTMFLTIKCKRILLDLKSRFTKTQIDVTLYLRKVNNKIIQTCYTKTVRFQIMHVI